MRQNAKCEITLRAQKELVENAIDEIAGVFQRHGFHAPSTANVIIGTGIGLAIEASGFEATIAELRHCANHLENQIIELDRIPRTCLN